MKKPKPKLMYFESKDQETKGQARIGWAEFSKTGKSVYYDGKLFIAAENGYPSNYEDTTNGDQYWISECSPDGKDRKYKSDLPTFIDEDAREVYWTLLRRQPENVNKDTV